MTDRRDLPRIVPLQPILGSVGTQRVRLLDISLRSVRVAHRFPLGDGPYEFHFSWDGTEVVVICSTMRANGGRKSRDVPETVLLFDSMSEESRNAVNLMIEQHVERALDEQRSNAYSLPPRSTTFLKTNAPTAGYVRCELYGREWLRHETPDPSQPDNGFTVSAHETPSEIDVLCQTYLISDRQGRSMIRRMAEISVSSLDGVATRRFTP